jgi:hypothetical protein
LIAQPLWTRVLRASLFWAVGFACLRESAKLNPVVSRAYALDGVAMPFIAVGLIDALEAVLLIFAWLLLGDDAQHIPRNPA